MDVARLKIEIDARGAQAGAAIVNANAAKMALGMRGATSAVGVFNGALRGLAATAKGVLTFFGPLIAAFTVFATLKKTISTAADFEYQLAKLSGITKATAADMQRLAGVARELGASTRYSATEAAEGLEFLALAGFNVDQSISALPATLNLATVGGIELGQAADFASNILGQFGLSADQTGRVVDTLTVASQGSNTSVLQLAEALKFAGTVAGSAGLSIEETAAAIGVLGDRGIQGAMAGTNLRQIILTLLQPTREARIEIERMGLSVAELDPTTQSLATIFKRLAAAGLDLASANRIFSSRTSSAALTLADSIEKMERLTKAEEEGAGAADEFSKKLNDTLKGSLKSLGSAIEEVMLQAGDAGLLGVFKDIVDFMTDMVRAIGGQETAWKDLSFAFDVFLAQFEVGWEVMKSMFASVKDTIQSVVDWFRDGFNFIGETISSWASQLNRIFGAPLTAMLLMAKTFVNTIIAIFKTVLDTFKILADGIILSIANIVESLKELASGNITKAFDYTKAAIKAQTDAIQSAIPGIGQRLATNLQTDFVGKAFKTGEEWAGQFTAGAKQQLGAGAGRGPLDPNGVSGSFLDAVYRNVQARQLERQRARRVREADKAARDAAAATAGAIKRPTDGSLDAASTGASLTRETFVLQSKVLKRQRDELRLVGLSNEARERAIELAELQGEYEEAFGRALQNNDPIVKEFEQNLRRIEDAKAFREFSDNVGDAMGNAVVSVLDGSKTIKDAFRDLFFSIQQQVLQQAIAKPISQGIGNLLFTFGTSLGLGLGGGAITSGGGGGGAAGPFSNAASPSAGQTFGGATGAFGGGIGVFQRNGGVWYGGAQIKAFATGGVVNGPTMFPMQNGDVGMMGEAGPEAILPLENRGGKLGVKGGVTVINKTARVTVVTRDEDSFRRSRSMVRREMQRTLG